MRDNNFNDQVKKWEIEESLRKSRIEWGKNYDNKCIWRYETEPLDFWTNWHDLTDAKELLYYEHLHRSNAISYEIPTDVEKIDRLNRLLIIGMSYYGHIFQNDWRGEPIKYTMVDVKVPDSNFKNVPYHPYFLTRDFIISLKQDNNGTCHGFAFSPYLVNIPHDTDGTWEIVDCYKY